MIVTVDFSGTKLVDHSVLENLHHFATDYIAEGGCFEIIGIADHQPFLIINIQQEKNKHDEKSCLQVCLFSRCFCRLARVRA